MNQLGKRFPRYSRFLHLYPTAYRREYGEQMLQTLADMLDDADKSPRLVRARLVLDFPLSVIKQQISYTGGIMAHEMPLYMKRNAAIGAGLLLPFLLALAAETLDKLVNHRNLYDSWLWQMPVLAIWVLWLPIAAGGLALASLIVFLRQRSRSTGTSWRTQLFDFRRTWPVLAVALAALFVVALVLFHDSVHCVIGNPVRELHNPRQTLHCIGQR